MKKKRIIGLYENRFTSRMHLFRVFEKTDFVFDDFL